MKDARRRLARVPRIAWLIAAVLGFVALADPFGVIAQVSGPIYAPDGSRTQPSYNFATSPRAGIFRQEKDNPAFVADGQIIYHYTTTRVHLSSGIALRVGDSLYVQGALGVGTDNPTSALHVVGSMAVTGTAAINGTTLSGDLLAAPDNARDFGQSGASRFRDAFLARNLHVAGYSHFGSATAFAVHAVTVADNGTGNGNAEVLPGHAAAVLRVECLDTQGCMLRFGEDGVAPGTLVRVVNIGAQNILVLDHATAGTRQHVATTFTGAKNATMQLIFMPDSSGIASWYELSRSSN